MGPVAKAVLRIAPCVVAVAGIVEIYTYAGRPRLAIVTLIFLLAVLFVSAAWGVRYAPFVAIVATLTQNYFLVPPVPSFAVDDPLDSASRIACVVTGITASQLAERARRAARPMTKEKYANV